MKRLVITESEKQRILEMHQKAANKLNLLEQTGNQTLDRILQQNNDAAWRFIDGVTAAEKAGTLGTVDEDKISELVHGIKTVDLYVAILWNIRNNVENNFCSVTSFAVKNMFGEGNLLGDIDVKYYVDPISTYLAGLCRSAETAYGGENGKPEKGGFEFECGEYKSIKALAAGCKGNFKTKATKTIGGGISLTDGGINP